MPVKRFTTITGKFAVTDYFDSNTYSHDPRKQFMNWSLMYNGAWDYSADTRGYTMGSMEELTMKNWSLRIEQAARRDRPLSPAEDAEILALLEQAQKLEIHDRQGKKAHHPAN